jgi:hypothetical protein
MAGMRELIVTTGSARAISEAQATHRVKQAAASRIGAFTNDSSSRFS